MLIFVALIAGTAYLIFRNKTKIKDKIFTMVRLGLIYVLALIVGLRPSTVKSEYEFATKNLDVMFVVDTTISMWARDYNGSEERMKGVIADIKGIASNLAGSNFALVSFDDVSVVKSPFSQDAAYVMDMVDTLTSPDSNMASGSDMSVPYKNMESLLRSSSKKENRKTIVFFFTDGEITNGKGLVSFEDLAQYVDGGAILGYGTEKGGKMKDKKGYVYDYTTRKDALSKIDEDNLQQMAEDLGIEYMNCNSGSASLNGYVQMIKDGSAIIMEQSEGAQKYEDKYFYFAAALAIMLLVELMFIIRRERL